MKYSMLTFTAIQAALALSAPRALTDSSNHHWPWPRPNQCNIPRPYDASGTGSEYVDAPSYYPGWPWYRPPHGSRPHVCYVKAPANGGDAAPNIVAAFKQCGQNGVVIFNEPLYHVKSVMNTTGLCNVEVDVRGTLLWDKNIPYWLNHSLPVGYQNQSSAWFFGGDHVWLHGNGVGTLDGNGQTWYDFIGNGSNYPGRPHAITFSKLTNSVVEGMRFVQSQMWTMTLIHSNNVLLQDIYVNNTNLKGGFDQNTDGADTIYANNITFVRWVVQNGDDGISMKANSTNMLIQNTTFHKGGAMAMGSIGQYNGVYEFIENVTARDIYVYGSTQLGYVKTWTGIQRGYPPNGGGGGIGHVKNITFTNYTFTGVLTPWILTQCTSYNGPKAECGTSKFQIEDMYWTDVTGTSLSNNVSNLACSAVAPCKGIHIENTKATIINTTKPAKGYLCTNVLNPIGFKCNGVADPY